LDRVNGGELDKVRFHIVFGLNSW